jgi:hypothetical protein
MSPEQSFRSNSAIDLYEVAEIIYLGRIEQSKASGELRHVTDIAGEEELDDHFDDLWRLHRQVHRELGLAWPPPPDVTAGNR